MSIKEYKIRCEPCSAHSLSNPLCIPTWLIFQLQAPGQDNLPTDIYACPACGGRVAVQNVPDAKITEGAVQANPDLAQGDDLIPKSWRSDNMPTLEDLGVVREEVEIQSAGGVVDAAAFRKNLLGGHNAPEIVR